MCWRLPQAWAVLESLGASSGMAMKPGLPQENLPESVLCSVMGLICHLGYAQTKRLTNMTEQMQVFMPDVLGQNKTINPLLPAPAPQESRSKNTPEY